MDNIEENNKLIAEFMGIELFNNEYTEALLIASALDLLINPCTHFINVQKDVYLDEFKFNKSWDWIMPVVEEIETLDNPGTNYISSISVTIYDKNCDIEYTGYESGTIIEISANTKIEATYKAVVKFIKWYSKNK